MDPKTVQRPQVEEALTRFRQAEITAEQLQGEISDLVAQGVIDQQGARDALHDAKSPRAVAESSDADRTVLATAPSAALPDDDKTRLGLSASDHFGPDPNRSGANLPETSRDQPDPLARGPESRFHQSADRTEYLDNRRGLEEDATQFAAGSVEPARPAPTRRPTATPSVMPFPTAAGGQDFGSATAGPLEPVGVGTVLKERFVLEEVIGGGGMGVVYKALDLRKLEAHDKDSHVALKVLNADFQANPVSLVALQRETKRAQALSHPNIINVFDFDRDGAHVFMTMEYLRGQPLSRFIKNLGENGLPFQKAWPIIQAMGEALAHAHKKDLVHSDFKPGNVFIDDHGEVKVLDFGIACAFKRPGQGEHEDTTIFNARELGALTPGYASLEMLQGKEPDPRDDVFALACVAYELLTGKHPYSKLPADQALECGLRPKPIKGLDHRRWKALQHGLALTAADRTASAEQFLSELRGRSPLFYGVVASTIVALLAGGTAIYQHFAQPVVEPARQVVLTDAQKKQIQDLLDVAEIHFEMGYITAPSGANALWAYQEILKTDPYNEAAIAGLKKIAGEMEQQAWALFEKGQRAQALEKVNDGLEADPKHEGLLKLKEKLTR